MKNSHIYIIAASNQNQGKFWPICHLSAKYAHKSWIYRILNIIDESPFFAIILIRSHNTQCDFKDSRCMLMFASIDFPRNKLYTIMCQNEEKVLDSEKHSSKISNIS